MYSVLLYNYIIIRGIKYSALCTTKFHLCCNQNNIYKLKNEEESKSTKL